MLSHPPSSPFDWARGAARLRGTRRPGRSAGLKGRWGPPGSRAGGFGERPPDCDRWRVSDPCNSAISQAHAKHAERRGWGGTFRRDRTPGRLVARTAACLHRSGRLRRVLDLGRVRWPQLPVRTIPVAVLLAIYQAAVVAVLRRASGAGRAARLPPDLLLLSQSLLPRGLPEPAGLLRFGVARSLHGRDRDHPALVARPAPLVPLPVDRR